MTSLNAQLRVPLLLAILIGSTLLVACQPRVRHESKYVDQHYTSKLRVLAAALRDYSLAHGVLPASLNEISGPEWRVTNSVDEKFLSRCLYDRLATERKPEKPVIVIKPLPQEPLDESVWVVLWLRGHVDLWDNEQVHRAEIKIDPLNDKESRGGVDTDQKRSLEGFHPESVGTDR
ncbi:MAG TPA: hypothetical protein VF669_13185 [Tepidisphaeraceae bacterium]|jgi:competence protein ComGC